MRYLHRLHRWINRFSQVNLALSHGVAVSQAVHDMFQSIAGRYDLTNDVLSFGIHRLWRNRALRLGGARPGITAVDLCTGTGDVALALARIIGSNGQVTGVDFVQEMLTLAEKKTIAQSSLNPKSAPISYVRSDASQTPLPGGAADLVTISFGIRNVDNPTDCLREMRRLLKPGGRAVILEFGQPTNLLFRKLYEFYSFSLMPILGGWLTGNRSAYEYLPRTSKAFPSGENFLRLMQEAGFSKSSATPVFLGIAYIYVGDR